MITVEQKPMIIPEPCCTLDISGVAQRQFVEMCKALGNNIRLEILKFVIANPGCITAEIVDFLPIAQATVSQHLKVLRKAGWVEVCGIRGQATYYCLSNEQVGWFRDQVGEIF